MSTIWNITPSFIQAFEIVHSVKKLSMDEMFKRLSLMMGGDGQSITKKQLDNYIKEAQKGEVSVSKSGLTALKIMQQNWDQISGGKDSITVGDLKDYKALLVMAFAGSFSMSVTPDDSAGKPEKTEETKKTEKTDTKSADSTDSTGENNDASINSDATIKDLNSMLNDILGGSTDVNDDSNADFIATLTNMIALSSAPSTVNVEA